MFIPIHVSQAEIVQNVIAILKKIGGAKLIK